MIEVTSAQLEFWIASFVWPFFRISAFLIACPVLGHNSIPTKVKVGFGALLALMVTPLIGPVPDVPLFSYASLGIIVEQLLIGISIGLCVQIIFGVVQAAGEFIGLQMGLGFATFFSPDTRSNSVVLSRYLYMISLLMFLAFNVHIYMVEIVVGSFQTLPLGSLDLNPEAWMYLARFASTIFSTGMMLALPLLGALLMMNLAMGILNRSAPQLTIFSIGFPLTLTAGLILMMVMMYGLKDFLEPWFFSGIKHIQQMLFLMGS